MAIGKLLDVLVLPCTWHTEWVCTLRALCCGAAGSWYLSMVRNGLFEALLKEKKKKKSHTGLVPQAQLSPEMLLPVHQMKRPPTSF